MSAQLTRNEIFQILFRVSIASVVTYYSLKWMVNQMDPTNKSKKKARAKAEEQINRVNLSEGLKIDTSTLSDYELVIASHLVVPRDINVSWRDIAGLESVVEELRENVIVPVSHRHLLANSPLFQAPKGVLLHGPPGCGKTLIAKATAKEAGMRFLNLDVAMLTDKWYGESQKLASAVFSLAKKIEPCIIFIDEIDSFLRSRNAQDHEATAMMKTQFMMLWDGLNTETNSNVIVMGATNRPKDLDQAILRRMPAQFHIGLPTEEQRKKILQLVLGAEAVSNDVDYNRLSKLTNGFSGSDLRELCRHASVYRVRKLMKNANNLDNSSTTEMDSPPEITMQDLMCAFGKMRESKMHTGFLQPENRIELD